MDNHRYLIDEWLLEQGKLVLKKDRPMKLEREEISGATPPAEI